MRTTERVGGRRRRTRRTRAVAAGGSEEEGAGGESPVGWVNGASEPSESEEREKNLGMATEGR